MKSFFKTIIWLAVFVLVLNRGMSQFSGNIPYTTTTTTMMAPHVAQYSETSTATTTTATASQTAIPTFVPEKVWTLDEIRQRINSVTGASIPMEDYVVSSDIIGEFYRSFGYQANVRGFYDYSTKKIHFDERTSTTVFPSIIAHESCHYILDHTGCRQMVGNYGGTSYLNEEHFCDVFAFRLFPESKTLNDAEYRVRPGTANCIDTYMSNLLYNCKNSNRFTCDISMGERAYAG